MDSHFNLNISEAALEEFEDALNYYKSIQSGLEMRFAEAINSSFLTISQTPYAFQQIHNEIRHFVVKIFPYVIHYKVFESEQSVTIISVFHASRNPKSWKRRS